MHQASIGHRDEVVPLPAAQGIDTDAPAAQGAAA